jgi:hypothetical protein
VNLDERSISDAEVASAAEVSRHLHPPAVVSDAPEMRFRRGTHGYATILRHLKDAPSTARQISVRARTTYTNAYRVLRQLHYHGLVHVAFWLRTSTKGPCAAVFAVGAGEDAAPPPGLRDNSLPASSWSTEPPPVHVEMLTFVAAWRELETPQTSLSLHESVGGNRGVMRRLLCHLRKLRLIYIAEWDATRSGPPMEAYARGSKPDARRPKAEDPALVWRRYDARRRAREKTIRIAHLTVTPMPVTGQLPRQGDTA